MKKLVLAFLLVVGCATTIKALPPWTTQEKLDFAVDCLQLKAMTSGRAEATRFCACVIDGLEKNYSFQWMTDGQEVTPTERKKVRSITEACSPSSDSETETEEQNDIGI